MTDVMPAAFIGHGSPMNALERNRFTDAWRAFGAPVAPKAVLVISAHWCTNATAVTAMPAPRTIHDFYGFPPALFDVTYPAPGDPELAATVSDLVAPTWVGLDHDSWGIDHGAWSVLVHAFPGADIPVLQLSIDAGKSYDEHLALGAALAPLRRQGVLILGSGNVVHNLAAMDRRQIEGGFDWARRFDAAATEVMLRAPADAVSLAGHGDHDAAVPTAEHFVPLLYIAGLAAAEGSRGSVMVEGYSFGSLSMSAYMVG